jgi:hypothetical protein
MKTLTNCFTRKNGLLLAAVAGLLVSCKKELHVAQQPNEVSIAGNAKGDNKIYVSDVNELYAAINNADNAGTRIILNPGTYVLDASFPNAGRIELQKDMSLQGQPGQADQVIIDASTLPANSFLLPTTSFPGALRTGVIRIGNGTNSIEWLAVKAPPSANALSVIETDLEITLQTQVRIAHCVISGGQIAVDIRNRDQLGDNRIIDARIEDNELFGNTFGFGQGIGIQNSRNVSGAVINAVLRNNYVHGNRMGIRAFNAVANHSSITVQSNNDRFEENGLGLSLIAGFDEYPIFNADNNVLSFEAHGATIINNDGQPAPPTGTAQALPGGVLLTGGQVTVNSLPGNSNNNRLDVGFFDCTFNGNFAPFDINAFGARSGYPSANPAGTNNVVTLKLIGISANASVTTTPSFPTEQAGTDVVNVVRN